MRMHHLLLPALLAVTPATAAVGGAVWTAPATLSEPAGHVFQPKIGVTPDGSTAVALWNTPPMVLAAVRTGSTWGAPVDLSPGRATIGNPKLAVGSNGSATAVWTALDDEHIRVFSSSRAAGGTWTADEPISGVPGSSGIPEVVMDANGVATAAFTWNGSGKDVVHINQRPAGGNWAASSDVVSDPDSQALDSQIAVDPSGALTVAWRDQTDSTNSVVTVRRRVGGVWGLPIPLSGAPADISLLCVASGATGAAVVVWGPAPGNHLMASRLLPDGGWTAPEDVSRSSSPAFNPQLAMDAQGVTTAVWRASDGVASVIWASQLIDGEWTDPERISPPSTATTPASLPAVATSVDGVVTVTWRRTVAPGAVVAEARRRVNGAWGATETLSGESPSVGNVQVASDDVGGADAIWQLKTGTTWIVQSSRINPPAAEAVPSSPAASPVLAPGGARLMMRILPSRKRIVSGQVVRVGIRTTSTGSAESQAVRACVRLPGALVIVRAAGARRSQRTACFDLGDLPAGASATRVVRVQGSTSRRAYGAFIGRVVSRSSGLAGTGMAGVTVVPRRAHGRVAG